MITGTHILFYSHNAEADREFFRESEEEASLRPCGCFSP